MGKEDGPAVTDEFVEVDVAMGSLRLEVWRNRSESQTWLFDLRSQSSSEDGRRLWSEGRLAHGQAVSLTEGAWSSCFCEEGSHYCESATEYWNGMLDGEVEISQLGRLTKIGMTRSGVVAFPFG